MTMGIPRQTEPRRSAAPSPRLARVVGVAALVAASLVPVPRSAGASRGDDGAGSPARRTIAARSEPAPARPLATAGLPSFLVANTGWTDPGVRYVAKCRGYRAFLTDDGVVIGIPERRPTRRGHGNFEGQTPQAAAPVPGARVALRFEGVRGDALFTARDPLPGRASFFLGDDPARWRSGLPLVAGVDRPSFADGVDVQWRISGGELRFDLRFAPGADPARTSLRAEGTCTPRVDPDGSLVLATPPGDIRLSAPVAWNEAPEGRRPVAARFEVRDGRIAFAVPDRDPALALVVDPTLSYAAYFGGSANDSLVGVDVDDAGALLLGGFTASLDLSVTSGAYQQTHAGGAGAQFPNDYFAAKFAADGTTLEWCSFAGGSGWDDAMGSAADANGAICIVGESASTNAPTVSAAQAAPGGGVSDGWIVRLAAGGSSLASATYFGGGAGDQPLSVAIDPSGAAVVAGWTQSTNLPVTGALQTSWGGASSEGFALKVPAAGGAFAFATYLGGNGLDQCNAVATDTVGDIYVTGWTNSTNFAVRSAVQPTYTPSTGITPNDAFVTKLSGNGASVVWSTYYGGSSFDEGNGITVDADRQAHVIGWTGSSNFPLRAPFQAAKSGADDLFVMKFTAAGSAVVWATLVGGSGREYGTDVGMDSAGNVWCSGLSTSSNFPLVNATQSSFGGGGAASFPDDTVLFRLRSDGTKLISSTYFGGSNYEDTVSIDVDAGDAVHFCGYTASTNLPVAGGATGSLSGLNEGFFGRLAPVLPNAPTGLAASSGILQPVQLSWTDTSTNETGFEIERRVGTQPWAVVKTVGAGVTFTEDQQVSSNVTFVYRVRATGPDGSSAPSNEASVTTAGTLPPPPLPASPNALTLTVVSATEIDLFWLDRSSDERGFEIQRREGGGVFAQLAVTAANADTHADLTCLPGWSYEYRVRAIALAGPSSFAAPARTRTPGSLEILVTKGKVTNGTKAGKDAASAAGTYAFDPASDGAWDPRADGLDVHLGAVGTGTTLTIPPGDPGWKGKGPKLTWKSAKGAPFAATVVVHLVKRTWSVAFSKMTFPALPLRDVHVMLHSAGDGGSASAEWTERRPGSLVAPAVR